MENIGLIMVLITKKIDMKKYTWNYAVEGVFPFLPLYITVEDENEQEAKNKAILKIQSRYGERKIKFFLVKVEDV